MSIVLRIISDTVSITALMTIALYHMISYLSRIQQETEQMDLHFSLFLFSLALYIFFDNSLSLLVFLPDRGPLYTTVGVALATLGIMIFLLLFLYRMVGLTRTGRRIRNCSYVLGSLACLLSFSVFFKGYLWYMKVFDKVAIGAYILIFTGNITLLLHTLKSKKKFSYSYEVLILISSILIILSLFLFRIIIACNLENYTFNNHIPVAAAVFIFPAFLTLKSTDEFRELILLKEHLREMHLRKDEEYKNRCIRFAELFRLNTREEEVMTGLLEGQEYKEIASSLSLSLSGVKKRVHSLYRKAGVQNRTELVNLVLNDTLLSWKQEQSGNDS